MKGVLVRNRVWRVGLLVAVALSAPKVQAGPGGCGTGGSMAPMPAGYEVLAVSSTALPISSGVKNPAGQPPADMCIAVVETDSVRYQDNGLVPTSTAGRLLYVTATAPQTLTICGQQAINKFLVIRVTTDASFKVQCYRMGDQ